MSFIREHIIKRFTRSSGWSKVRREFLKKHPKCELCGNTKTLEVHHIKSFHLFPELELDPENLITLCRKKRCHLLFGHLNNWKYINNNVERDLIIWREKISLAKSYYELTK